MENDDGIKYLDTLKNQIGHKLVDRNISRAQLAEEAGIKSDTLDNLWKSNRKKPLYSDDLYKISRVLGCSMEELVTGEEEVSEQEETARTLDEKPSLKRVINTLSKMDEKDISRVADSMIGILVGLGINQKGEIREQKNA